MKKILKFTGIALAAIVIILLLIIGYAYGRMYIAKIGRLPEGTAPVLVDSEYNPLASEIANQTYSPLAWPVPEIYKQHAADFHWWLAMPNPTRGVEDFIREAKPTIAVVFDLPVDSVPALAVFSGTVRIMRTESTNNKPAISEVELQGKGYEARYERLLTSTVTDNATIKTGDIIGTIVRFQRAIIPKDAEWKTKNIIGSGFNFKFSLFKILENNEVEPVWITTRSFTR